LRVHKNFMYVSLHFYYVASIYKPGGLRRTDKRSLLIVKKYIFLLYGDLNEYLLTIEL